MKVRRATPADATAIRALTREAYAKWVPLIGREPLPMAADYDKAVKEHIIELCEEGDEVLGLVEVIPASDHLMIENLAVRPAMQGRGIGSKLLSRVEEVAQELGLPEVQLYTNAAFAANLAFYAGHGYAEFKRGSLVPGSVTVFMRKAIAPSRTR